MSSPDYRPSPRTKHKAKKHEKAVVRRYEVRLVFGKDRYVTANERGALLHSLGKRGFVLAHTDDETSLHLAEPLQYTCPDDAPWIGLCCTSFAIYDGAHHLGSRGVKALRVFAGWQLLVEPHPEIAAAYQQATKR